MRFCAATALCAAPLALAGSLQADLVARGAIDSELAVRNGHESKNEESSRGDGEYRGGSNGGGTRITEIIIIWVNTGNNAPTRSIAPQMPAAAAPAADSVAPPRATHTVTVGGAGGLVYTPDQVNAAVGDVVIFEFHAQNHSASQSTFDAPCSPLAGGMDTGFMANPNNSVIPAPQVAMQVTISTPLWFYCRQGNHCGKGMVFSINPTANKTQAKFQQMAIAQKGAGTPVAIIGGQPAASTSRPPPPGATTPPPAAGGAPPMIGGAGQMANGVCACTCLCGTAAFPNPAAQGVGAYGGFAGAIPMAALEA